LEAGLVVGEVILALFRRFLRLSSMARGAMWGVLWLVFLLLPYLLIGDQRWGPFWFKITSPFSELLKPTWDSDNPWIYRLLTSAAHSVCVFVFMWVLELLVGKIAGGLNTDPEKDKGDAGKTPRPA
jgi:hypothetical protein